MTNGSLMKVKSIVNTFDLHLAIIGLENQLSVFLRGDTGFTGQTYRIDKAKILMTNGSLMKVKSIAECSPWSILQYF